jgi:DNA-binding NarL/FixJ family response regulator
MPPATSLAGARAAIRNGRCDLVLASEDLEGDLVVELVGGTGSVAQRPPVLLLAQRPDPSLAAKALRAGARGWVSDDCTAEELADALTTVWRGRHWVPPQLRSGVIDALLGNRRTPASGTQQVLLSPRQQEVLACLLLGMSHAEAAEALRLSLSTVRSHVRNMCRLTSVHSTPALVALAREGHLLTTTQDHGHRPRWAPSSSLRRF